MAATPDKLLKKYKKIVKAYNKLCDKRTPGGKRAMTYEAIYEKLSEQFYLSEAWIERIVKKHS